MSRNTITELTIRPQHFILHSYTAKWRMEESAIARQWHNKQGCTSRHAMPRHETRHPLLGDGAIKVASRQQ
jgi:N-dimethylarginine dimethylaminohydrolase